MKGRTVVRSLLAGWVVACVGCGLPAIRREPMGLPSPLVPEEVQVGNDESTPAEADTSPAPP